MKYLLLFSLILSGCASSTQYGKCVGLNSQEDPKLRYEYSAWNIAIGVIFLELVIPPLFVVLDELKCPVDKKENK